jgi:hypothetical protein
VDVIGVITLGGVTAVGGGTIRDVLVRRIPSVLHSAPNAAVTPAARALQGQLDGARTRITSLEQETPRSADTSARSPRSSSK